MLVYSQTIFMLSEIDQKASPVAWPEDIPKAVHTAALMDSLKLRNKRCGKGPHIYSLELM